MKRVLAVIIIIILSLCQFGCSTKQLNTPSNPINKRSTSSKDGAVSSPAKDVQKIKLVKKTNKTKYLLTNGIEILPGEKLIATSKGKISISTFSISGLSDKSLETRINNSITNDTQNEIENYVKECTKMPQALSVYGEINANNLLSISIRDFSLSSENDGGGGKDIIYGCLYRLTDGQRLYLKDIFTEGTDYISLINQKVVEGILREGIDEENNLSEPFKTIDKDQNFVLSSKLQLDIIFNPGECGFKERNCISIPLSEIDDYVDVMDRYSSTQRKTQEKSSFFIRENNIFTDSKGEIIKRNNGDIMCSYPEISGLRDDAFENIINSTINKGISEVADSGALDSFIKVKNPKDDDIPNIRMYATFNSYGILSINRLVTSSESCDLQQFSKIYSFDLINKKVIDTKDIIKKHIGSNKDLQNNFTNAMRKNISDSYMYRDTKVANLITSIVDYSYAMENAQIEFVQYNPPQNSVQISVHFSAGSIKGFSDYVDCTVPLSSISNGVPEDFFGW